MVRHLFKMIWNKKKQNMLLMVEMLASFMVVFAVFTLLVYNYQNYRRNLGFEPGDVWVINFNNSENVNDLDTIMMLREAVRNQLKSMPEIKSVSYSSANVPFSMSTHNGSLTHGKQTVPGVNRYTGEDDYDDVLNLEIKEGRWFNKADFGAKDNAVVINASLKERLFGSASPIDKYIGDVSGEDRRNKIIGVVADTKFKGDFQAVEYDMFHRADTSAYRGLNQVIVKVIPGAGADFEGRLHRTMSSATKNANVEIEHLSEKREARNNLSLVPMIILLIVAGFLIINVALGLFGVLWYNISKRKGEIGLRRAVGASGLSISKQLVGEALVLSTLSLIIGSFFVVQFPLLHLFDLPSGVYLIAWLLSLLFIYLLVMLCAFYPGRQAAGINPAVALHEE
ncbi:MAG: FtsX-like permease family protein [Chitinophagaceae bacterium]|nr:MAG: FtsX-like permease family protein [Chitinophagaceae bacterium]